MLCILGLLPFIWLSTHHNSKIAQLIAFNGLLFHTFFNTTPLVKYYDIICNVLLTIYVNTRSQDPWVPFFTIIGIIGFLNNINDTQNTAKDIAHVFTVQLPLFIGLLVFT